MSSTPVSRISASMFYKYDACPHWLYFDAYGDPSKKRPPTAFADMLMQGGLLHEETMIAGMKCVKVPGTTLEDRAKATLDMMRKGIPCIYHGVMMDDEFIGEPDILERVDGRGSVFGQYHYVAVDIKSAERLLDAHKHQLSCYGELLDRTQGVRPGEGYVLNGAGTRVSFPLADFKPQFDDAVAEIKKILAGEAPAPKVSSGCKQSPWFKECVRFAEERDDIALLYNVKKRVLEALREYGIRTVHDAADIETELLSRENPMFKRALLERMVLQAQSLIDYRHFVRAPIDLPEAPLEIFFDIEGDPLRQVEYLFGFLVRSPAESGKAAREEYVYQIAEKPEGEAAMWLQFQEWVATLEGDYVVYHYGTYELTRLNALAARHGVSLATKGAFETFRDRLTDLNEIVKDSIVFPLYFYGIKDIGTYIGYKRHGDIAGGGESVAFYEDWLAKGDRKVLDAIIEYNKDDVIATRHLKDWLAKERDGAV